MKIVTYFTPRYMDDAAKLKKSVEAAGKEFYGVCKDESRDWVTACSRKAGVCLDALTCLQDDILWMDADSWLKSWPQFFDLKHYDAACYVEPAWNMQKPKKCSIYQDWAKQHGGMWTTGVLLLRYNNSVMEMVHNWKTLCAANPSEWDQISLQKAYLSMENPPKFKALPRQLSCYGDYIGHNSGLKRHWKGQVSSES